MFTTSINNTGVEIKEKRERVEFMDEHPKVIKSNILIDTDVEI